VGVAVSGFVVALVWLAFAGTRAGLSAALGAAFGAANLWAWAKIVAALLPDDAVTARTQSRGAWVLVALLKILVWVAVAALLMRHTLVAGAPLLVGLLTLPIGIAIGTLVSDRSAVQEEP
jgi:hypothetical protein